MRDEVRPGDGGRAEVDVPLTLVDGQGLATDVRVRCAVDASVAELAEASIATGVRRAHERDLWLGDRRLPPDGALGSCVLPGSVLHARAVAAEQPSLRELRVVGGLASGDTHPLRPGVTVIGRGPGADVPLDDDRVSRSHVRVTVDRAGVTVADLGSTNGARLDGQPVPAEGLPWSDGGRLRLGDTVVEVGPSCPPPAPTRPVAGRLHAGSAPRLRPAAPAAEVRFPDAPPPPRRTRLPVAATLAPLAVGVVAAVVLGSWTFLLFALLSPVVVVAGAASDRGQARRDHEEACLRHRARLRDARTAVARAVAAEETSRHDDDPDCAALRHLALHRGPRLWERRAGDGDVLRVRVGTADLPARVRVVGGPPAVCRSVPVTVALREAGVLGIGGGRRGVLAVARAVVAGAAVLHPPTVLEVLVLTATEGDWAWTRWLPHLRSAGGRPLDDLLAAVDRGGPAAQHGGPARPGHPITLVVLDDPALRDDPRLAALAARGPAAGVHLLCLAAQVHHLPAGCTAVLADGGHDGWVLHQDGHSPVTGICPDGTTGLWAESVARDLAPLTPPAPAAAPSPPDELAWSGLEGLRLTGAVEDVDLVLARWAASGPEPAVTLGATAAGPLTVDLCRDGPHCLVAGTTGSGKSELLQTLVAGLAASRPPEALQLVLVDYKGGAAFGRCVDLPHTAGLVTDLDPALTRRALTSLSAELRRREALLLKAGAADLQAYEQRAPHGPGLPDLARLVIVVDEFATLAEELPDFVRGLVGVAQRGRSLGVHLVLATQRPEGAVSADIRANTSLRVCLAVPREAESRDVLDAPDAARISRDRPGRGYLRRGPEGLVLFQTARVAVPPPADTGRGARPLRLDVLRGGLTPLASGAAAPPGLATPHTPRGEARPAGAFPEGVRQAPEPEPPKGDESRGRDLVVERTDLDLLVAACRAASAGRGVPLPARPWLPPLPERLLLSDLAAQPAVLGADDHLVPFALQDVPAEQGRRVLSVDLRANLAVVGGPRSGRTTTLLTVAGAAATRTGPDRLHLVGLDFGGTALRALERLPHCGTVVSGDEPDRLARLVAALAREVAQRRTAPRGGTPPRLLVLLDSWDGFVAAHADVDAGRLVEGMTRVLREGPAVGVTAVVSSDRTALVGRVSGLLPQRLLLRLPDPGDYAVAGVAPREVPADLPPGRGVHDGLLTHVALLDADPAVPPAEVLARLDVPAPEPGAAEPLRVDPLPTRVPAELVESLRGRVRPAGRLVTPGIGGDRLGPLDVDLDAAGPVLLVAGPPRSGRSTALLTCLGTLLDGLRRSGTPPARVLVVAPRPGPLRTPGDLGLPVDVVVDPGPDLHDLAAEAALVVVDDAEQVTDPGAVAVLDTVFATAGDARRPVLAAGTTSALLTCYRRWAEEARRGRTGLLLTPESGADGELFGLRLPRSTGGDVAVPGRGLLVVRGDVVPVQVALPPAAPAWPAPGRTPAHRVRSAA